MKLAVQLLAVVFALLGLSQFAVAAHPADGHPISGVWGDNWHYPPAELSYDDITFMEESEYPDFDSLSQLEQYMLMGVTSSAQRADAGMLPWSDTIFHLALQYYRAHGEIPEALTPDVIRTIPGHHRFGDECFEVERNPLTGEYPRLKAAEHSPGDCYLRVLTEDEVDYFVENGLSYLRPSPHGHELDEYIPSLGSSERVTPVCYMRMYGYDGVLSNGFKFICKPVS
jgi:hypothetical protein